MTGASWERGLASLRARLAATPAALRRAAEAPLPRVDLPAEPMRRVVTTGLGSSEAHARCLAWALRGAGVSAHFVSTGAFTQAPPQGSEGDVLVVFSQGLSPNARFALDRPEAWGRLILVSAVDPERRESAEERARADLLARLAAAGALHVPVEVELEFGTLVRVIGPAVGTVVALRLAAALARAWGAAELAEPIGGAAAEAFERGRDQAASLLPEDTHILDAPLALIVSGGYGELVSNLRLKLLEGLLRPLPAVFDLLEYAHGPFQQASTGPAGYLVLARRGAPHEDALLARFASLLDPAHHAMLRLEAQSPLPLCLLEHEALLDGLLLRRVEERRLDLHRWPAKGRDGPLYALTRPADCEAPASAEEPAAAAPEPRLAALTWPELEERLGSADHWAILALGATEQHGAHLPADTDTRIATSLAERVCRREAHTLALPPLSLGCSSEHTAFPGTLSLEPETLRATLLDLARSIARQGFAGLFVFSAHGGNLALLGEIGDALAAAAAPARALAFADGAAVARAMRAVAAEQGVSPEALGHHAGELETSVLLAIEPAAVRTAKLEVGLLAADLDAQSLFYPSLRENAPAGVVGDPRAADPARAPAYLDAWADVLVAALRAAKNDHQTKGTVKP